MEKLRKKLEKAIEKYGAMDKRVLELSQQLDVEVANAQKALFIKYKEK